MKVTPEDVYEELLDRLRSEAHALGERATLREEPDELAVELIPTNTHAARIRLEVFDESNVYFEVGPRYGSEYLLKRLPAEVVADEVVREVVKPTIHGLLVETQFLRKGNPHDSRVRFDGQPPQKTRARGWLGHEAVVHRYEPY